MFSTEYRGSIGCTNFNLAHAISFPKLNGDLFESYRFSENRNTLQLEPHFRPNSESALNSIGIQSSPSLLTNSIFRLIFHLHFLSIITFYDNSSEHNSKWYTLILNLINSIRYASTETFLKYGYLIRR